MTTIAMLAAPIRGMGVRMCGNRDVMAYRAPKPRALADMAVETMILAPGGVMGQRPCIRMAGITGILLMANHTFRTIPFGLHAVGLQPPQIVM